MNIGLYFGSFNPIHFGHINIANFVLQTENIDQVWFIVSPQNPFKNLSDLAPENDRLQMAKLAVNEHNRLKISDIELHLPRPSYTINTLEALEKDHKDKSFSIIMGADNLEKIGDWYRASDVLKYPILAYPREASNVDISSFKTVKIINAPLINISSTMIRNNLKQGKDIKNFTHQEVIKYIERKKLYFFSKSYTIN